jgi:predicted DNA-binding protein with PD1-like motif
VHAHVVVVRRDGTALGGHLLEARVSPTLEVVIEDSRQRLGRRFDETSGPALIDLR